MIRKSLLLSLMFVLTTAAGNDLGQVDSFSREKISTYDAQGTFKGRENAWKLPKTGAPIVDVSRSGFVAIKRGSEIVYLRIAEVITTGLKGDCINATSPAGKKPHTAATGMGSGMSKGSARCVPRE